MSKTNSEPQCSPSSKKISLGLGSPIKVLMWKQALARQAGSYWVRVLSAKDTEGQRNTQELQDKGLNVRVNIRTARAWTDLAGDREG